LSSSEHATSQPDQPLATFGEGLRLLGIQVAPRETEGGASLTVELTLDTASPQPQSYNLLLHALDANGQRLGQRDGPTGGGLFPTDVWQPGQAIRDTYQVPIDRNSGTPAQIAVGFYDWRTGERLPVLDPDGRSLPDGQFLIELD
jgi:hypothetical protein